MQIINLLKHLKISWFFLFSFLFALTACGGGQVCGADDPSNCVLNKNSPNVPEEDLYPHHHDEPDNPFVPPTDDEHEKTIPDEYIDTLKQVEFEFNVTGIPNSISAPAMSFDYKYTSEHVYRSGSYELDLSAPSNIQNLFKPIEEVTSEGIVTTNAYLDDSNANSRDLYVTGTVIVPVDNSTKNLQLNFATGLAGQGHTPVVLTASFPYQNPAVYQVLEGHFGSGTNRYSNLRWIAPSASPNYAAISANYRVIPQGQHNKFKIDITQSGDGSLNFKLIKSDGFPIEKRDVFLSNSNITNTNDPFTKALEGMFAGAGCPEANISKVSSGSTYTFTINDVCDDFMALQMSASGSTSSRKLQFKLSLLTDDGDVFEPIIFDGTKPTPITTMNLLPRIIAPK